MALPASCVWEVRTTGNDANGGGFNASRSGATKTADDNYTYGASYGAISYTDLYSDGASLNKLKSDTRAFVTADIGHIIQLGAGTNRTATLFFEITAVASGVATLDANAWSAENSAKDGVGKLGGALATPGQAAGCCVEGNTVWIAAGTYSFGTGTANTSGNCISYTSALTRYFCGYTTSRSDRSTKPIFQASANMQTLVTFGGSAHYMHICNIRFDGNGYTDCAGCNLQAERQLASECEFYNLKTGANGYVSQCYAESCTTGFSSADCSVAKSCTTGFTRIAVNCIAWSCTGVGYQGTAGALVWWQNCLAYGCGSHGFATSQNSARIINCLAVNNTGKAFSQSTNNTDTFYGNAQYNNSGGTDWDPITLTGAPFVNAAAGIFQLIRTGAGAQCRAAGIGPVGQTSYSDIGAVQHGDTTVPAVGDVESGVTFGDGAALTGTFVVPAEEDVEDGVTYGAGGTEFEGTLAGGGGVDLPDVMTIGA